jgi:surface antigen Omp85-like protein
MKQRLLLLAAFLFLLVSGPALVIAQSETDDSEKTKEELTLEIQQLRQELNNLKRQLAEKADEKESQDDSALEQRIENLEKRIVALEKTLDGTSSDDEWDFESFEDEEDNGENDWEETPQSATDFEDWASVEMEFFQKYPAAFDWPFPMGTSFSNTFLRYNRVEGLYIGLAKSKRLNWHSKKRIVSTFSLGYGFASKRGRYSLGMYFPFYFDDQILEIGGEGHLFTDSKDQWTIGQEENTLMAFFAREDFMDYFQRGGFSAGASWYYRSPEERTFRASVHYVHDTYKEMGKETDWSLFGGDKVFRENPIMNNDNAISAIRGNINSINIGAGFSTLSNDSRSQGWKVTTTYEIAGGFAAGDYEFNQFIFDARRYQPLGEFLQFNGRFRVGATDGIVPFARTFDLGGPGTLPGYRYKMYSGTHLGLFNAEIIVKSELAGVSDGWFKRVMDSFNLIFFYDVGAVANDYLDETTGMVGEQMTAIPESESVFGGLSNLNDMQWLSSIGVAAGSSDGTFRVGVAWPMTGDKSAALVVRLAAPF